MYIILEGTASVTSQNETGEMLPIADLKRGDFFGEIALFSSHSSAFTVEATSDLKVITIFPDEVFTIDRT
ncbi:MAG: cyclic nucleotide-binding domain-containing protein [Bacteroidota bacterium]